jgi:hypothetical protein
MTALWWYWSRRVSGWIKGRLGRYRIYKLGLWYGVIYNGLPVDTIVTAERRGHL